MIVQGPVRLAGLLLLNGLLDIPNEPRKKSGVRGPGSKGTVRVIVLPVARLVVTAEPVVPAAPLGITLLAPKRIDSPPEPKIMLELTLKYCRYGSLTVSAVARAAEGMPTAEIAIRSTDTTTEYAHLDFLPFGPPKTAARLFFGPLCRMDARNKASRF